MSRLLRRRGVWYADFRDERGRRRISLGKDITKAEAKATLAELVAQTRRRELGLEPVPVSLKSTVWQLVDWWLTHRAPRASVEIERARLEKHVKPASIGWHQVAQVKSTHFEAFFSVLEHTLSGASINHIRAKLRTAFERARREGVFNGINPLLETKKRKTVRRQYETLTLEEAHAALRMTAPQWRGLVACCVFLALRKGEAAALQKSDVDLVTKTVRVGRSWERDVTKGGEAAELPLVEPLMPYLVEAFKVKGELLFPDAKGRMRPRGCDPHLRLRTALKRLGFEPERIARIRLHDLRHTTATLLLRAGVELHHVQRILRHASPETTANTYAHLVTPDIRRAMGPLERGPNPAPPEAVPPTPPKGRAAEVSNSTQEVEAIPARFERATPGFGGHSSGLRVVSEPERALLDEPVLSGLKRPSGVVAPEPNVTDAEVLAPTRHTLAATGTTGRSIPFRGGMRIEG